MSEYTLIEKIDRADWNQQLYGRLIYETQRSAMNYPELYTDQLELYEKVQKRWIRIRNRYIEELYNKYITNKGCECCTPQNK
jgi:hypothetical protein